VVGLPAGNGMTTAVSGNGHRVDCVDRRACRAKTSDQQPAGSLDRDSSWFLGAVSVFCQQLQQVGESLGVVVETSAGLQCAGVIDDDDVVVITGPVDAAEDSQIWFTSRLEERSRRQGTRLSNGRARRPGIRLAVRDPSGP
jgi:hypothetical protein